MGRRGSFPRCHDPRRNERNHSAAGSRCRMVVVPSFDRTTLRKTPTMQSFTIRDLRERPGELSREAGQGHLALMTRHGHPLFISVPFSDELIQHGVGTALAESLYRADAIPLGKAAKLAGMSITEFAMHLSQLGIPVVDYDGEELLDELRYFEQ